MQIWYKAAQLLPKLSPHLKDINTEIHTEVEMPEGWFSGKEKAVKIKTHPPSAQREDQLNEVIVKNMNARMDVLLAKQLLVYARLNRFYM
jgi:hypothetical protein